MKRLVLMLLACAMPVAAYASHEPSFAQRVAAAKRAELEPVSRAYLRRIVYPAMGTASVTKRIRACLNAPNASKTSITLAATISAGGAMEDVDYRPRTGTGSCLAAAMRAVNHLPPPPENYKSGLPFVYPVIVIPIDDRFTMEDGSKASAVRSAKPQPATK